MVEINNELVSKLIKTQFPKWADLPIYSVEKSGHDNRTFHLGNEMTVRLPSRKEYAPQVEKELMWLPKLGQHLSLPISSPIASGKPAENYPFPWSINKWIEGDTVTYDNVKDLNQFAVDLAKFLKEFQEIDATNGPIAGEHNFFRGGSLNVYNEETQNALINLKDIFEVEKLSKIWADALQSEWEQDPVWVHGDVAVGNLLVRDGKLCGVIDFGILGVGDPACDYVMAWTFFDKESREIFRNTLECDENTWNRAKGWALWKALIVYDGCDKGSDMAIWAKDTIDEILRG